MTLSWLTLDLPDHVWRSERMLDENEIEARRVQHCFEVRYVARVRQETKLCSPSTLAKVWSPGGGAICWGCTVEFVRRVDLYLDASRSEVFG